VTSRTGVNLEAQIDNLLESMQNKEIRQLISSCNRKATILLQLRIYLESAFNCKKEAGLKQTQLPANSGSDLLQDKGKLKHFLENIEKLLIGEIDGTKEEIGAQKNLARQLLHGYATLGDVVEVSIDEKVREIETIMVKMKSRTPDHDLNVTEINELLKNSQQISSEFQSTFLSAKRIIIDNLPDSFSKDIVEIVKQPNGVKLRNIDLKTLQSIYDTPLRDLLRIVLSFPNES
jgi:hypothetical protein